MKSFSPTHLLCDKAWAPDGLNTVSGLYVLQGCPTMTFPGSHLGVNQLVHDGLAILVVKM